MRESQTKVESTSLIKFLHLFHCKAIVTFFSLILVIELLVQITVEFWEPFYP